MCLFAVADEKSATCIKKVAYYDPKSINNRYFMSSQTHSLITALKGELKRQGRTYADCAEWLALSEASVKRLFSRGSFSLERLETICRRLGLGFSDLARLAEQQRERLVELSLEQERELVADTRRLLVAVCLLNHWQPEDILRTYRFSQIELTGLLGRLDRIGLIELLPGNRVRLAIGRDFKWRAGGPIQQFFSRHLQSEFFASDFAAPGECRIVVTGMLSESANAELIRRMRRLAAEFSDQHDQSAGLPLDQRYGTTLVLAMRPWEAKVFAAQRLSPGNKRFGLAFSGRASEWNSEPDDQPVSGD